MKTKSLLIAALVVVTASVSAFAKEEPTNAGLAIVPVKGSQTYKVVYKSSNAGSTKVNIYNSESKVIFTESISNAGGFILPLNFDGLSAGEYTIELTDATGTKTEKISYQPVIKSSSLPVSKSSLNIHVAKLSTEGKFLLAVGNTNKEVITVKIYDSFNNLIFKESKELNADFAQVYALKNTSASYTFEVSDNTGNIKSITF